MGYEYSEPPINKNGKFYLGWKEITINKEIFSGYCPYYFEDQTVEEYDMDIKVGPKKCGKIYQNENGTVLIADNNLNTNWQFIQNNNTVINGITDGSEILIITRYSWGAYRFHYYRNFAGTSITVEGNSWVYINEHGSSINSVSFAETDITKDALFHIYDEYNNNDDKDVQFLIFDSMFGGFNINWMTFN